MGKGSSKTPAWVTAAKMERRACSVCRKVKWHNPTMPPDAMAKAPGFRCTACGMPRR